MYICRAGASPCALALVTLFSVISANIAISDISLKTRFFEPDFNHFYAVAPKSYRIQ